jgi:hypothetical protein
MITPSSVYTNLLQGYVDLSEQIYYIFVAVLSNEMQLPIFRISLSNHPSEIVGINIFSVDTN